MTPLFVVHQQGRWLSFDGQHVVHSDARPKFDRAATVVSDFEGAVSSVVSLEGSPAHAVALIEKRLRSDGMIDTDAKILIHKTRSIGAGYQTLFTAVPLDLWQQTYAWAEAQPDHCLLIPSTSLLWKAVTSGHGVVLQAGRQLSVLALHGHDMLYRTTLAYSDDPQDLAMAAGAMADQLAEDLAALEDTMHPLTLQWCPVLVARPDDDAPWTDDMLREVFSARSGLQVTTVPLRRVLDAQGREYRSGAAWMASACGPSIAVNPAATRAAYLAERVLPYASAASLVFALVLGTLGARWALSASEAEARADQLNAEVSQIESRIEAMREKERLPDGHTAALAFVERAARIQAGADPADSLARVRDAAAGEVRILRLRIDEAKPAAPARGNRRQSRNTDTSAATADVHTLRVDGVVDPGRGTPGMQLANFVARLRMAGYDPQPVDPLGGGGNGNRGSGGSFSYLLTRPTEQPQDTRS
ncbi:hypothetical protein PQS31_03660 [Luteimonas sp BLCC-B24]|uniref:hypothetical protein n=1 Tax=Luteimonas sp. BLCC-B24 TaxID=3025317 RepID=UPI00234DB264|nr:hypothetical protein [Luteimonas sp. BLCC-B24]MDC7805918.1 hypothetical protein [Luteimonas sp. BLCC-B24]